MRPSKRRPAAPRRATSQPRLPFPPKPRAVYFGTSEFAVPPLRALAGVADCTLVVTQPDRPARRGQRLQPTPVKLAAIDLGIPTIEPERLRDALERLAAEDAALFAVASYGKIVPQAVLDLVPLALNVHPSLLPSYRGATPLQSQLRDGVCRSGVSVIAMDAGMDTGDVVLVQPSEIGPRETYGELHDRFAALGADLLARAVRQAELGTLERTPQSRLGLEADAEGTLTRTLGKDDLRVSLSWPLERIANAVRAFAPNPLARARLAGDEDVKLLEAYVVRGAEFGALAASPELARLAATARPDDEPGEVLTLRVFAALRHAIVLPRGDAALVVTRLVPPNRGAVDAADYLRGASARARAAEARA